MTTNQTKSSRLYVAAIATFLITVTLTTWAAGGTWASTSNPRFWLSLFIGGFLVISLAALAGEQDMKGSITKGLSSVLKPGESAKVVGHHGCLMILEVDGQKIAVQTTVSDNCHSNVRDFTGKAIGIPGDIRLSGVFYVGEGA